MKREGTPVCCSDSFGNLLLQLQLLAYIISRLFFVRFDPTQMFHIFPRTAPVPVGCPPRLSVQATTCVFETTGFKLQNGVCLLFANLVTGHYIKAVYATFSWRRGLRLLASLAPSLTCACSLSGLPSPPPDAALGAAATPFPPVFALVGLRLSAGASGIMYGLTNDAERKKTRML